MEAIAKTKYLKGSPRKARLVIDLIRGRNVSQALAILKFTDKRAADPIEKCVRSAIANATFLAEKQNIAIDPDDLFVKSCFVDMGPHKNRRRMRPAPQGRAYREQRHYCHITILVSSDKPAEKEIKESKKGKEGDKSSGEKEVKVSAKKSAAKSEAPKKTTEAKTSKKAKAEEPVVEETVTQTAAPEETKTPKATEASKAAEEVDTQATAEASDAKDVTSQTTEERHETKPADEAQLDRNEELERQ
jgi:large subunit ribosomal protein L22